MGNRLIVSAMCLSCWSATAAHAADNSREPKAVIEKALRALGGEENVAKYKAANLKVKGIFRPFGNAEFTREIWVQLPDKSKAVTRFDISGMKHFRTEAINGAKGWKIERGKVLDLAPQELTRLKDELYSSWLATILPLKDPTFQLSSLGEAKVEDKPATGIHVSHKVHGDVDLYFDDDSGLLVRTVRHIMRPGGKDQVLDIYYSDYKDCDGVKVATKTLVKLDGKEVAVIEATDIKLLDKIDDKVFEKPPE